MRSCLFIFAALLGGCASEDPLVPLMHINADSEETARESVRAIERAGVRIELVAVRDLDAEQVPDWVDADEGGWLLLGREGDRERAEQALSDWHAELEAKSVPSKPRPEPLALGRRRELDPEERGKIVAELARRRELDQAVRKDPRRRGEMAQVDADNTGYLIYQVLDVGWIDSERFGRAAADAAFLLVQHSGDLSLMLAALPEIEREARAGVVDAQNYALLYDRTQLLSGGRQRYGTQVRVTESGEQVVHRLEDPDRVDDRRKALGLEPLRDYLARFDGEVRIER